MKSWNFLLASLCWASMLSLSAQDNSLNLQHSLILNEKSVEQTIKVDVAGDVEKLKIDIRCSLDQGAVVIALYDPDGKRQGKFTLGSKTNIRTQADADGKNDVQRVRVREAEVIGMAIGIVIGVMIGFGAWWLVSLF